jgi:sodium-dependent dicarboxylate transporter 2/3/5
VADLRATIKFNNVCRNFSSSLYYVSSTKDFEVLDKSFFKEKYKELGAITLEQKRVFVLFIFLVFMWILEKTLSVGNFYIPGWSSVFPEPSFINDGTIAYIAVLLFIVPESIKRRLLTWDVVPKIPWGFTFCGGFALAKGFIDSGLSNYVGEQLIAAGNLSDMSLLFTDRLDDF